LSVDVAGLAVDVRERVDRGEILIFIQGGSECGYIRRPGGKRGRSENLTRKDLFNRIFRNKTSIRGRKFNVSILFSVYFDHRVATFAFRTLSCHQLTFPSEI
jgi:hypothetical protein